MYGEKEGACIGARGVWGQGLGEVYRGWEGVGGLYRVKKAVWGVYRAKERVGGVQGQGGCLGECIG